MSGITVAEAKRYFSDAIPNGSNVYVGLFTTLPAADGTGGVEATYDSYARVAHSTWLSKTIATSTVRRENIGAVEMIALGLGGADQTIVGWGIWDASTSGNLRHWGPLRSASGVEAPQTITVGDQIRWTEGTLQIQISPATDQTESMIMETVYGPTQTTDATPTTDDIYTVSDEESVDLEVTLIGKHTNAGATDYHYRRKLSVTYYRDDGASGTVLGHLHAQDVDGAATRIYNLTTATATVVLSGNTIQAQFTGEALDLDWYAVVKVISSNQS